MRIYRIEHLETGLGPFYMCCVKPKHIEMPSPIDDGVKWERTDARYYFAFTSKKALLKWFSPTDIVKYRRKGFRVVEYTVSSSKVHVGNEQCVFIPSEAYSKKRVPFIKLLH